MSTSIIVNQATRVLQCYAELLDNLPVLELGPLAEYVSQGLTTTERHAEIANKIIQSRYTMLGYKDYMCCYLEMNALDIGLQSRVIDIAIDISRRTHSVAAFFVQHLLGMLYYHNTIVTSQESGKGTSYIYRSFHRGVWYEVEKSTLNNAYRQTLSNIKAKILRALDINDNKLDKAIQSAITNAGESILKDMLHYPKFSDCRDDKTKVFCTSQGIVLDIKALICRLGLPGDLTTLSSRAKYDSNAWQRNRDSMMQALTLWLTNDRVSNYYLDCLSSALSVYVPRYGLLNVGSGSDGKSTFVQVLHYVFGSYCGICPTSGPGSDAKSANDVTPVLNMLQDKRLCVTPEVKDVNAFLSSPGYKSIVGGDVSYNRGMFQEANANPRVLKQLCIFNTNQLNVPVVEVNERTRIRVIKFNRKTIDSSDKDVIPQTKIQGYTVGIDNYGQHFIDMYADTLITELMLRYIDMQERRLKITMPPEVTEWTMDTLAPKEMYRFLEQCTLKVTGTTQQISNVAQGLDDRVSALLSQMGGISLGEDRLTVQKLYNVYTTWRNLLPGYSRTTRLNDITTFAKHLEFYVVIEGDRDKLPDISQRYVTKIKLKPESELVPAINNSANTRINLHHNVLLGMQSNNIERSKSLPMPNRGFNLFQVQPVVHANKTSNPSNVGNINNASS